jgi:hypothetical protein
MKYFPLCIALLSLSCAASAQQREAAQPSLVPASVQASAPSTPIQGNHRAYAAGTYGNGSIHGGNATGDNQMGWAFEVRFGTELDLPGLKAGQLFAPDEKFRVDVVHYNEGHPDNHHRDGFALQGVYSKLLSRKFTAELGVGPYYSMDTSTRDRIEYNKAKLGVLASAAVLIDIDDIARGMHVRVALNHVTMPGAHASNALLVGVGKYFDYPTGRTEPASGGEPLWLGLAGVHGQTNHGGTETSAGYSLEAKKHYGRWATSVSAIIEGDDDVRVDRKGVALQGWLVQPMTKNWTASAGFGPYIATNNRSRSDDYRLMALFSLQLDRAIGNDWRAFANFSRVNTFREKNDRDLLRIGVMKSFGG